MTGGTNAFDSYAAAALEAEALGGSDLSRVSFTNALSRKAMAKVARPLAQLEAATSRTCEFQFTPRRPFEKAPYQSGWRLLGRCLVWKIQDAVALEQWDTAATATTRAIKFGFDLTGGSATDASLGFTIVNEARQAVSPALPRMDGSALSRLSVGVAKWVRERPDLGPMIRNEHALMLQGVQFVQDAYRAKDLEVLNKSMGSDTKNAIDYLKQMEKKDTERRPGYFQGFAAEAEARAAWLESMAKLPMAKRSKGPTLQAERPWRRFAKQLFEGADPILRVADAAVARTRLLVIEAQVIRQVKTKGIAQTDLSGFSGELATDPFTGGKFEYRADGAMYSVYSVGTNKVDDGGETDESFTSPDLLLERGLR